MERRPRRSTPPSIELSGGEPIAGAGQPKKGLYRDGAARPAHVPRAPLRLEWRWATPDRLAGSALVTVVFASIVAVVAWAASREERMPLLGWAITACFAILPAATAYELVATAVNSTYVTIDGAVIAVRHGPIPFGRAVAVDARSVRSVSVRLRPEDDRRRRRSAPVPVYELVAHVDGSEVVLAGRHPDRGEIDFVREVIEDYLDLPSGNA